jgi:transcriptional regulator with XRE-family HTH domain
MNPRRSVGPRRQLTRGAVELRRWMKANSRTQEALAKEIGVRQATISNWVVTGKIPQARYIVRLRALTGIPLAAWAEYVEVDDEEPYVRTGTEG